MADKWIQGAIKHPGAFKAKASTQTKRQANLAKELKGFSKSKGSRIQSNNRKG